jgi:hypothetical protein
MQNAECILLRWAYGGQEMQNAEFRIREIREIRGKNPRDSERFCPMQWRRSGGFPKELPKMCIQLHGWRSDIVMLEHVVAEMQRK